MIEYIQTELCVMALVSATSTIFMVGGMDKLINAFYIGNEGLSTTGNHERMGYGEYLYNLLGIS